MGWIIKSHFAITYACCNWWSEITFFKTQYLRDVVFDDSMAGLYTVKEAKHRF